MKRNFIFIILLLSLIILFAGCNNDEMNLPGYSGSVIIATNSPDKSSGAHSILKLNSPESTVNNLLASGSDISVEGYKDNFYRIERFQSDSIAKISINYPGEIVWQFSVRDENDDAEGVLYPNPYSLIILNESKGYLLRYGSSRLWIVNPSATRYSEFKLGEIDLSHYDDSDGFPEMCSGLIVGTKLFIVMQRLNRGGDNGVWSVSTNSSYIAVYETDTDTDHTNDNNREIDTGQGSNGLFGIELSEVRNPYGEIVHYNGIIYVPCVSELIPRGSNLPVTEFGGIQKIDATSYAKISVIEKGVRITSLAIDSDSKGYMVQYNGWSDTSLKSFNPGTGVVNSGNVWELDDGGDANISSIAVKNGRLWILDSSIDNSGVIILNTSDDSVEYSKINVGLQPMGITFCDEQ